MKRAATAGASLMLDIEMNVLAGQVRSEAWPLMVSRSWSDRRNRKAGFDVRQVGVEVFEAELQSIRSAVRPNWLRWSLLMVRRSASQGIFRSWTFNLSALPDDGEMLKAAGASSLPCKLDRQSLFFEKSSLFPFEGNWTGCARFYWSSACSDIPEAQKLAIFPLLFPVSRESLRSRFRIPLRRQPTGAIRTINSQRTPKRREGDSVSADFEPLHKSMQSLIEKCTFRSLGLSRRMSRAPLFVHFREDAGCACWPLTG
jgi:hypothetical protein